MAAIWRIRSLHLLRTKKQYLTPPSSGRCTLVGCPGYQTLAQAATDNFLRLVPSPTSMLLCVPYQPGCSTYMPRDLWNMYVCNNLGSMGC